MSGGEVCTVGPEVATFEPASLADPATRERLLADCLATWIGKYRSAEVREMYRRVWGDWCVWCAQSGVSWLDPPRGTGVRYVEAQSDRYAPNTVLKHMSIVSSGLQALRLWGLRHGGDPFAGEVLPPRKRQAHPEPKGLIYPFAEVVDAARTVGPRHELCVLLLGGVGLRASMAAQVHDHRIILGPFGRVCTVIAKGGREFSFPVPPALWALSRVDGWPCDAIPTGRNGVNRVGVALRGVKESDRRDRINEMVNDVARVMGVHLHPHQFRHWHVTMALELGVPLHIVQDSVGHADPKTTMGYARDRARVKDHTVWTVLADITGDRVPT